MFSINYAFIRNVFQKSTRISGIFEEKKQKQLSYSVGNSQLRVRKEKSWNAYCIMIRRKSGNGFVFACVSAYFGNGEWHNMF